ncbi:MAG: S9 family peptidase [Maricaulis sp.]|uniref:S9 family peptidase n=1 Tax=Maricaulis sp. TaxID=1486257 RepID=UPI0026028D30|nr:S9 family peptidase [Maricaulis sp.]MDM7983315.1 S9 family peptidase [Maricaulis sp.]
MIIRSILVAVAILVAAPASYTQPPLEQFAERPAIELATLSPDGNQIAFFTNFEGGRALAVRSLITGEVQIVDMTAVAPAFLRWADDRMLLVSATVNRNFVGVRGSVDVSATFFIDTQNNLAARQLLQDNRMLGVNFYLGNIIGIEAETGHALIPAYDRNERFDLFAVDPMGRGVRRAGQGQEETRDWVIDARGLPIARNDYSSDDRRQVLRTLGEENWEPLYTAEDAARPVFTAWGLLPSGDIGVTATFTTDAGRSLRGLYALSIETGDIEETVFLHPTYDLEAVITDPYTNGVVGVTYEDQFTQHVWFDEQLADWQSALDTAFPDQIVRITSWSRARDKLIISVENERQSPALYLFDVNAGRVDFIGTVHGELGMAELPARRHIEYTARDGTVVPAYLTTPEGDGPFPSVILPHGGPALRETGGYHAMAHFLASRGYAVLQPNFRGSDGYGYEWRSAGFGEWGTGVMQDDVTDGVQAMIEAGIVDADRVCIVGWSYGGYAALAGASFTPELYDCAVAIAPVSNLPSFISYVRQRYGRDHWSYEYWSELMQGDADLDGNDALRALSPIHHAENIQIPVLLLHGENDNVVDANQSSGMARALRRAGGDVEYIELDEGDHSLDDVTMQITLLRALETFLAEHIGE